jgi:hypothetical protein
MRDGDFLSKATDMRSDGCRPQHETFSCQHRVPEQTLLYRVLAENQETFLDRCRTGEHELPRYVDRKHQGWHVELFPRPGGQFPHLAQRKPLSTYVLFGL